MTVVRHVILLVILAVCGVSCVSLWHLVPDHLSNLLLYLVSGLLLGSFVYQLRYGYLETNKMVEAQLSRAAVLGLSLTAGLVAFSFLWEETTLRTVAVCVAGAGAMYGFLRERKPTVQSTTPRAAQAAVREPERPPKTNPFGDGAAEFDWDSLAATLTQVGDRERLKSLQTLRRVFTAATEEGDAGVCLQRVAWTVQQEAQRLVEAAKMAEREHQDGDMLTKASELVEWAIQKTPEITELDVSDLLLAKAVADIIHLSSDVTTLVVDLNELKAIHNVDRDTALQKSEQRARAALQCLPLLERNGLVLTEALISTYTELKSFESISGIQVVALGVGQGYVTFEGNGRAWALKQAFSPDLGLKVEVRLFEFASGRDSDDVIRRVQRVRAWKKVTDDWPTSV